MIITVKTSAYEECVTYQNGDIDNNKLQDLLDSRSASGWDLVSMCKQESKTVLVFRQKVSV